MGKSAAFTLLEMMVAMSILAMLMVAIASVLNHTTRTVKTANAKLDAFQTARAAYDSMSQKLSQAILNTYWDYDSPTNPTKYVRNSNLHFLTKVLGSTQSVFFQAPEGISSTAAFDQTQGLLNACGFFVQFGSDYSNVAGRWTRPAHVRSSPDPTSLDNSRYRYRLMQSIQPADSLGVFQNVNLTSDSWTTSGALSAIDAAWPIADNVIALIIQPRQELSSGTSIAPNYLYDSRNGTPAIQKAQLPPILQVTMVVMDESSAARLAADSGSSAPPIIEAALAGKFAVASQYQTDLDALETALVASNIRYRIFSSSIMLRESKWSSL